MTVVTRSALLPYSDAEVFALVNDVARYREFLPYCTASEVLLAEAHEMRARMAFSWRGLSQSLVTHNRLTPTSRIDIEFVEGPFEHLRGGWEFIALQARACKVSFSVEFRPQARFLNMVADSVVGQAASQAIDAFSRRAEALYGRR
jgi:ribosome-associated toxin RatA of RatAB toxin-antitoxin module